MENKNTHANIEGVISNNGMQNAMDKLHAFCTSNSIFKTDKELRDSVESFVLTIPLSSAKDASLLTSKYCAIVEEILEVLHDLEEELSAHESDSQPGATSPVDSSNRLYASLKRHPE